MQIDEAMRLLTKARDFLPNQEEFYLAEVRRVVLEYGQAKWNDACAATVQELQRGVAVDGFSYKPR